MADQGALEAKIFGQGAGTKEKRAEIRGDIAKQAQACAGKPATEGLIDDTARLFSRYFLVEVALSRKIKVNKNLNKAAIVELLFNSRWVVPTDEQALEAVKEFGQSGSESESSGEEDASKEERKEEQKQEQSRSKKDPKFRRVALKKKRGMIALDKTKASQRGRKK